MAGNNGGARSVALRKRAGPMQAAFSHPLAPTLLRRLLRYEPDSGKLFWLQRTPDLFIAGFHSAATQCARWNSRHAGNEAFTCWVLSGYPHTTIFGRTYHAHRVIFALVTSEWPEHDVDHINGNRGDNRWRNLRSVTHVTNSRNAAISTRNSTGATGVHRHRETDWTARIGVGGKTLYLGVFRTFEAALASRKAAERQYGFHPNHGRKMKELA